MAENTSPNGIDLNLLGALEARLGRSSMVGLIAAHMRHGKAIAERLQAMARALDRKELQAIGHQIVGSCGSIGLTGLSELGGALEDEAAQAPAEVLQRMIESTLAACREAQTVLLARYPEVAA